MRRQSRRRVDILVDPYRVQCKKRGVYHPVDDTPSASRSLSSSPKGGAEGASRRQTGSLSPSTEPLSSVRLRAAGSRPYRSG